MALLDDLVAKVADENLRAELAAAVQRLKKSRKFGLVFEEHIPETSSLLGYPVEPGALVELRTEPPSNGLYQVESLTPKGKRATVIPAIGSDEAMKVDTDDLCVVKPFGEPIYPALKPLGTIDRAAERPYHAVIDGENFHVLQLLAYLYQGQVDCIYADPPYNTGARDWKYNNRYVDAKDSWRHSKWLSMMERRLKLAKKLLRPNSGVLIVTIDEHEVNHLGVLLEQIFPEYLRYMVTSVINPKGTFKQNFGRVDEQLFFVVPDTGGDVVVPRPRGSEDIEVDDTADRLIRKLTSMSSMSLEDVLASDQLDADEHDLLVGATEATLPEAEGAEAEPLTPDEAPPEPDAEYEYWFLRRRGQESSYRHQRPNSFYAMLVNEKTEEVVGTGPHLEIDEPWEIERHGDVVTVYPIDNEGHERVWRYARQTMQGYIDAGEIVVGRFNRTTKTWTLNHRKLKKDVLRHKTVWWYKSHDAGVHGTNVVNRLLGARNLFPFPKSIYAVRDTLAAVVRDRPDALILDFFAGSGTTLHSTCMLNVEDGGRRRCVLVTNNEVDDGEAARLHREGFFRGDPEFEARGIFEQVTRPRVTAAISGVRPDGEPVPGRYMDGRPFADGFEENVEFFRLQYLNPEDIDLGRQFEAILPGLWLAGGGVGAREVPGTRAFYSLPVQSPYGLLFRESRFRQFREALAKRPDVKRVWLVTDSEEAFAEMAAALPGHVRISMLYRDYLRNFRINMDHSA